MAEDSKSPELRRREGSRRTWTIAGSKDFLETGKKRLAGDRLGRHLGTRSTDCVARPWRSRRWLPILPWTRVLKKSVTGMGRTANRESGRRGRAGGGVRVGGGDQVLS